MSANTHLSVIETGCTSEEEEKFDFSKPENVFFYAIHDEQLKEHTYNKREFQIEELCVMNPCNGAATYEQAYGASLDYTVSDMIDDEIKSDGFYVMEDVTGVYTRGDGWMTDDDMDFYCGKVRPATEAEIEEFAHEIGLDNLGLPLPP